MPFFPPLTPEKPTVTAQPQPAAPMNDHRRSWLDAKNQPHCADCFPPLDGVAVIDVTATVNDQRYEQEERVGMREY